MMRRAGSRLLAAVAGVAAVAALAVAPAHGAPAASREFTSTVARTSDGRAVDDTATKADVARFWTAERMRRATPARAPRPARTTGAGTKAADAAGTPKVLSLPTAPAGGAQTKAATPSAAKAVGKVFFIDPYDNREHYCSAAVVSSNKGKLVQTAAHCVYSHHPLSGRALGFMSGWIFQPNYQNGPGPGGSWISENLVVPTAYTIDPFTPGTDIGMAIMAANGGTPIMYAVGGNGLIVNQPYSVVVTAIGYPAAGKYANDGRQLSCAGRTVRSTSTQIALYDCDFTFGASGGPWMVDYDPGIGYGWINSVTSAVYCQNDSCNPPPLDVYGVYFVDLEADLYYYSEAITI